MGTHSVSQAAAGSKAVKNPVENEHAYAIKRVLDAGSRDVVGWLYQWGTGDLSVMWKGERCENVIYE